VVDNAREEMRQVGFAKAKRLSEALRAKSPTARLNNRQCQDDIVRKARYIFRSAGVAV
jgi:hypothetical protein